MISDVEYVRLLDSDIAEEYQHAVEFLPVKPDYACLCLRKAGEILCRKLAEKNSIAFLYSELDHRINTLHNNAVINRQTKDALHQMRMICNAGVHKNAPAHSESDNKQMGSSYIEVKRRQSEEVRKARNHFLAATESVYSALVPGGVMPEYNVAELKTQINKDILHAACISSSPQAKLKAGLVFEAMAEEQSSISFDEDSYNSYTRKGLICPEHEYRHFAYLYQLAAESYDSACYISAWETKKGILQPSSYLEDRIEDWVASICDLESLYRYGVLTCEGRLGEEKQALGIRRLRAAASRNHIEAAAACGTSLYNKEEYRDAHTFLQRAAEQDDVLALRMLYFYYSENKAVPVDREKAVEYLQRAIEQGCPEALAFWGIAHFDGVIVEKDAIKGNSLLRQAKEMGSSVASKHFFTRELAKKMQKDFSKAWKSILSSIQPRGVVARGDKVGRNEPCPCGSGKKYKKCCGK
jgi:TPR repeat protein